MDSTTKKKLRGLAHHLDPIVYVGQNGFTKELMQAFEKALDSHELIKVKFVDCKDEKKEISEKMAKDAGANLAGIVGNIAIFYRQNPDPEKRKISL